ncbi:TetR/AcrR family transcriptional regulator [Amycolatopsis sp. GM8]|uniref:TetR/AcrR family transcriptional regulator n=1 Tax=Amycolatopsis sp. GM8 TaxID=2896530 RepID=UPI001F2A5BCD|nr:TetR/AcrR family transcriptional regulator [Amycolatopsis sp. GM8]
MTKPSAKAAPKRRQRGSINADDIVAGAFEVARASTLDQLSMPILAEHLDIGVTSIHWYFHKKEELLNAMTDRAVDKVVRLTPEVRSEDTWQHTLAAHFRAQREIHREDEVLSDLLLIRTSTYSRDAARRMFEVIEAIVAKLVADGFTPDDALKVYNAIGVYTRGSIIHARILRLSHAPTTDTARQRRMIDDWTPMPVLDGLLDRHTLSGTDDEDFDFGIGRLICGFEELPREQGERRKSASANGSDPRNATAS